MEIVKSEQLEVGKTYDIRSSRKGMFWGRCLELRGEFADFQIVSGKATFLSEPDRIEGDSVCVRLSLCKFYPIKEQEHIPIEQFGKDHWSTFIYVETRAVDHKGKLDNNHMRTDVDRHPMLLGESQKRFGVGGDKKYTTRLKNYFEDKTDCLEDHDDWDCIADLIAVGLIEIQGTDDNVIYKLTEKGWQTASQLRQHKANGGQCSNFEPKGF